MSSGRGNVHLIRVWRLGALGHSIKDGESNVVQMWGVANMEGHILPNSGGLQVPKNN